MHRGALLAIATLVVAAFLSGCGPSSPSQSAMTYARYQHSCCEAPDINQTWHPGSKVQLHWTVKYFDRTPISKPAAETLSVVLSGPYVDVGGLKSDVVKGGAGASRIVTTPNIATDDHNPVAPVSTLSLPPDLQPGYYNLTFKVDFGGGNSWGGASIVQVGP
jgi:hypothetical protein